MELLVAGVLLYAARGACGLSGQYFMTDTERKVLKQNKRSSGGKPTWLGYVQHRPL